jgi:hypothetical protein
MRLMTAIGMGLVLAAPTWANVTSLTAFLRKSPTPVTVPGGSTTFVLDPAAPVASTPVAESVSVVKNSSAALPAFTAPTFTQNTTLPIKIGATVHLSANLGMGSCAQIDANVLQIDPLGNATVAATVGAVGASIPQGSVGGTVGFGTFRFDHPGISCSFLDGIPILDGGSVALQVVVTNNCDANRTVSLAYDAVTAPGEVDFVVPTKEEELALRNGCQQKCGTAKMKAAGRKASDRTKCFERAVQKSTAVDPGCLSKADLKLFTTFQNIEAGGGCVFTGDAPAVEAGIDSAVGAFVTALQPASTDGAAVKCAATKMKAAAKKAENEIKCHSSAFGRGQPVDARCLAKAGNKLLQAFQKADAKGGCSTTGDGAAIETIVDQLVDGVVDRLMPKNPV